jgi:predicted N-acyltransferase
MPLVTTIKKIGPEAWKSLEAEDFPFTDYGFLLAMEDTGSVGGDSGWQPVYLQAFDASGLAGVLIGFVKTHSYGEYIFDWDWARFYQRYQVPYYPKLLFAIPFTPATGPRILLRADADAKTIRSELIQSALQIMDKSQLSSIHALFITPDESAAFEDHDFVIRHSLQYHWRNQNYRDFQDYLDSFIGKRRRDIARERQRVQTSGLSIQSFRGADLTPAHGEAMEQLYLSTAEKKDAIPYLRPGFFTQIFSSMPDNILLVLAMKDQQLVAGSLNFYKGSSLFGRYWGCFEQVQDLHFELCYYQTIDFAIQHDILLFEAGAQGEHKIQRGFRPSLTLSAHRIREDAFRKPSEKFISDEKFAIAEAIQELDRKSPFKV